MITKIAEALWLISIVLLTLALVSLVLLFLILNEARINPAPAIHQAAVTCAVAVVFCLIAHFARRYDESHYVTSDGKIARR